MAEFLSHDDIVASQRKEKKELLAKAQRMKHVIPKGDKRKKKEVNAEIGQMLSDLDLKHDAQLKECKDKIESMDLSNLAERTSHELTNTPKLERTDQGGCFEKDITMSANEPKPSRAQRRRNQKVQNRKERQRAIAEQEIQNLSGNRHLEFAVMKKKLAERNLGISEIPSDGNCLYKAIEHQLSVLNMKTISMESLRQLTSEHLLANKDEYLPFLVSPETGNTFSDNLYIKYCEDIRNTAAWGGHVEIQALSNVCGASIEVIQAEGPSIIIGDGKDRPRLIISYHRHAYGLGEHYNSVIPLGGIST